MQFSNAENARAARHVLDCGGVEVESTMRIWVLKGGWMMGHSPLCKDFSHLAFSTVLQLVGGNNELTFAWFYGR